MWREDLFSLGHEWSREKMVVVELIGVDQVGK